MDEIRDGEIYGWAFNSDDPGKVVKVGVYVNQRHIADVLALYYRPDVEELINCSGRHGFYLDLPRFCNRHRNAIVDVRFPNGQLLEHTPIYGHLPVCDSTSNSTLLFMHIPKTAGTALREVALANYKESEIAYFYTDPPGFPIHELPSEQRAGFRIVWGHFHYGLHFWLPENRCWYFAIVRNPVSRVWSQYNHYIEEKDDLVLTNGRIRSLEEMLENGLATELDNAMVRYFAGADYEKFPAGSLNEEVYDLAIHHLEQAFPYVGLQERLGEAYQYLRERIGWTKTPPLALVNAASYSSTAGLGDREEKLIGHFNKWDMMLYKHVCRRSQPVG